MQILWRKKFKHIQNHIKIKSINYNQIHIFMFLVLYFFFFRLSIYVCLYFQKSDRIDHVLDPTLDTCSCLINIKFSPRTIQSKEFLFLKISIIYAISIYFSCLFVCFSVFLFPISVGMAGPNRPNLLGGRVKKLFLK